MQRTTPFGSNGIMIPDEGWRMWPDTKAAWQQDEIFLPEDVDLKKLPTNPPTGGWEALNPQLGTELTLPATVEQYHWGLTGLRPYTVDEYRFQTYMFFTLPPTNVSSISTGPARQEPALHSHQMMKSRTAPITASRCWTYSRAWRRR